MSYLIAPGSTKSDRAIKFGRELDAAMRKRGVGRRLVASALGASSGSIMYWRTGRMLPRIETARKLAETLEWPRLATLAVELRAKTCIVCKKAFVDDSGSDNRAYCTQTCRRVKAKGVVGIATRTRAAMAERRLTVHQLAVAAYCHGCEPSGRCVTAECALRPVSPLPLFERREDVAPVQAKPRNGYRAPGTESARMKAIWARYTPEERAARVAKNAHLSRVGRGLVPAGDRP